MKEENNNIKDKRIINEQSLNYESINKDYLQKIFEINSFFKNMNALKNNNDNKIDNMNTINYDINRDKNLIKTIQKNENIKDIDKYFIKKVEKNEVYKKKKREKLHDKISQTEKTFNLVKKMWIKWHLINLQLKIKNLKEKI